MIGGVLLGAPSPHRRQRITASKGVLEAAYCTEHPAHHSLGHLGLVVRYGVEDIRIENRGRHAVLTTEGQVIHRWNSLPRRASSEPGIGEGADHGTEG